MRTNLGVGLVEVIIASTLGLLLLGLLHRFLLPIIHTSSRVSTRAHFSEQANHALNRLSLDLQHSTSGGLSYKPLDASGDSLLAISRRDGLTASGRSRFEDRVVVYLVDPSTAKLRRRVWPPGPPTLSTVTPTNNAATTFAPDDLLSFLSTPSQGILLAADVGEFEAIETWPPGPVLTSRLVLQKNVAGRRDARFELQKQTALRN